MAALISDTLPGDLVFLKDFLQSPISVLTTFVSHEGSDPSDRYKGPDVVWDEALPDLKLSDFTPERLEIPATIRELEWQREKLFEEEPSTWSGHNEMSGCLSSEDDLFNSFESVPEIEPYQTSPSLFTELFQDSNQACFREIWQQQELCNTEDSFWELE